MSYANDMPTLQSAARTDAGLASELRLSVARLSRRLRAEREPDNPLSVGSLSALGVLFREGECTDRQARRARARAAALDDPHGELAWSRRATSPAGRTTPTAGRCWSTSPRRAATILLADRRRRDAWLARRLRELTPDERDLLRQAAPLIQRLATS